MKPTVYLLFILFVTSCHSGKYYANYRYGGKADPVSEIPVEIPDACSPEEPIGHLPEEMDNPNDLTILQPTLVPAEKGNVIIVTPSYPDTTVASDSSFIMDDDLAQAYASPLMNSLAALFGAATLANAEFAWLAATFYFGAMACILIGLICFLVALVRYTQGRSDRRNKKYLWLWLLSFIITLILAAFILTLLL